MVDVWLETQLAGPHPLGWHSVRSTLDSVRRTTTLKIGRFSPAFLARGHRSRYSLLRLLPCSLLCKLQITTEGGGLGIHGIGALGLGNGKKFGI